RAAEPADDALAPARQRDVTRAGVAHDLGLVEGRAQHGGVRDLAAQAAADAALIDVRHGVAAQRIGVRLHRQRRAARKPDAGMVAGADRVVDAVARLGDALAARQFLGFLD